MDSSAASNDSLDLLRTEIDQVDDQIIELLGERFKLSSEVGKLKLELKLDTYQVKRETAILERLLKKGAALGLDRLLLQALFLQIFAVSRRNQE
jgi:chorismate mutase